MLHYQRAASFALICNKMSSEGAVLYHKRIHFFLLFCFAFWRKNSPFQFPTKKLLTFSFLREHTLSRKGRLTMSRGFLKSKAPSVCVCVFSQSLSVPHVHSEF